MARLNKQQNKFLLITSCDSLSKRVPFEVSCPDINTLEAVRTSIVNFLVPSTLFHLSWHRFSFQQWWCFSNIIVRFPSLPAGHDSYCPIDVKSAHRYRLWILTSAASESFSLDSSLTLRWDCSLVGVTALWEILAAAAQHWVPVAWGLVEKQMEGMEALHLNI